MRFISHFDLSLTREYFLALFTFSGATMPQNGWFVAHYLLAQILIMYMPFSKLLHFGGIFYSEALIQKH
jgi:nitrate reductase gamma subunit